MATIPIEGVELRHQIEIDDADILSTEALTFIKALHVKFNPKRLELLNNRARRQDEIDRGDFPAFLESTRHIREGDWKIEPVLSDLQDRRVEITGPAERKMIINALNSGAKAFMADFEDSLSPTWRNLIDGQIALKEAVRRDVRFKSAEGKVYELKATNLPTLIVRPRGWHLSDTNVLINGATVSASLFDFGMYFFHNSKHLLTVGSGPYFYLPKLENHLEARLWNEVFSYSEEYFRIPNGSIKATVLIETILAAFEMDEILYELKEHAAGLNAGRWDYMFSVIKKFRKNKSFVFPDRTQVTMTAPFMRAYTALLVRTCHKRGAHAIGGMAAFIPSRKDPEINKLAFERVKEDKKREARDGFDGTWVAHPDLVPLAFQEFQEVLQGAPNQKDSQRHAGEVEQSKLIDVRIEGAIITEAGLRNNINVSLQYLDSWLRGTGAAAIHNLMEDAATAEISRSELWQWIHHKAKLSDGRTITAELYRMYCEQELKSLGGVERGHFREASKVLDDLVLNESFTEFLTIPAYELLEGRHRTNLV